MQRTLWLGDVQAHAFCDMGATSVACLTPDQTLQWISRPCTVVAAVAAWFILRPDRYPDQNLIHPRLRQHRDK